MNSKLYIGLLSCSVLTACGGGSDGNKVPVPSSGSSSSSYQVTVIDGYLENATVWLDVNQNYLQDVGEPSAHTDKSGVATLDVTNVKTPDAYPVVVNAVAGQTVDLGKDLHQPNNKVVDRSYVMLAPSGAKEVTPLSTLLKIYIEQERANDSSSSENELQQRSLKRVADQLRIAKENVLGDFIKRGNSDVLYAAQNIVNSGILPTTPDALISTVNEVKKDDPSKRTHGQSKFLVKSRIALERIKNKLEKIKQKAIAEGKPINQHTFDKKEDVFTGKEDSADTDNDGIPNHLDAFPLDEKEWINSDADHPTRSDNVGDNADDDDDGDGVLDHEDDYPLDSSKSEDPDSGSHGTDISDNKRDGCEEKGSKEKTVSALLIGNSLMHGVQGKLVTLLECGGYKANVSTYNPGGKRLYQHNTDSRTIELINRGYSWVYLQEQSAGIDYWNLNDSASTTPTSSNYDESLSQLVTKIRAVGSRVGFYQTWGYSDSSGSLEARIEEYEKVGLAFNAAVIANGRAWQKYSADYPSPTFSLFSDDRHASVHGQSLISYLLYSYLTTESPINLHALDLKAEDASILQDVAWQTYVTYK